MKYFILLIFLISKKGEKETMKPYLEKIVLLIKQELNELHEFQQNITFFENELRAKSIKATIELYYIKKFIQAIDENKLSKELLDILFN